MNPPCAHATFARPTSVVALERMERAGLKNRPQRTAVIEAFFSSDRHVTTEDLALHGTVGAYQKRVRRRRGFEIDGDEMGLHGACAPCRAFPRSEP